MNGGSEAARQPEGMFKDQLSLLDEIIEGHRLGILKARGWNIPKDQQEPLVSRFVAGEVSADELKAAFKPARVGDIESRLAAIQSATGEKQRTLSGSLAPAEVPAPTIAPEAAKPELQVLEGGKAERETLVQGPAARDEYWTKAYADPARRVAEINRLLDLIASGKKIKDTDMPGTPGKKIRALGRELSAIAAKLKLAEAVSLPEAKAPTPAPAPEAAPAAVAPAPAAEAAPVVTARAVEVVPAAARAPEAKPVAPAMAKTEADLARAKAFVEAGKAATLNDPAVWDSKVAKAARAVYWDRLAKGEIDVNNPALKKMLVPGGETALAEHLAEFKKLEAEVAGLETGLKPAVAGPAAARAPEELPDLTKELIPEEAEAPEAAVEAPKAEKKGLLDRTTGWFAARFAKKPEAAPVAVTPEAAPKAPEAPKGVKPSFTESDFWRKHFKGELVEGPKSKTELAATLSGVAAVDVAGSVFGYKAAADIPRYLSQRIFVGQERDRLNQSIQAALAKEKVTRVIGEKPVEYELQSVYAAVEEARQAVEQSKYLTAEQKTALLGRVQSTAEMLRRGEIQKQERDQKIAEAVENFVQTRISGATVVKETLNSTAMWLVPGGAVLRPAIYGGAAMVERWQKVAAERVRGERAESQLKEFAVNGFREWYNAIRLKEGKTGLQKAANAAKAAGTVARAVGIGALAYHGAESIDQLIAAYEAQAPAAAAETPVIEIPEVPPEAPEAPVEAAAVAATPAPAPPEAPAALEAPPVEYHPELLRGKGLLDQYFEQKLGFEVGGQRLEVARPMFEMGAGAPEVPEAAAAAEAAKELNVTFADYSHPAIANAETLRELAVVREGDGITHVIARQIERSDPGTLVKMGYKGDFDDGAAKNLFALKEAYKIAEKDGLADTWLSHDSIGKTAVVLTEKGGEYHAALVDVAEQTHLAEADQIALVTTAPGAPEAPEGTTLPGEGAAVEPPSVEAVLYESYLGESKGVAFPEGVYSDEERYLLMSELDGRQKEVAALKVVQFELQKYYTDHGILRQPKDQEFFKEIAKLTSKNERTLAKLAAHVEDASRHIRPSVTTGGALTTEGAFKAAFQDIEKKAGSIPLSAREWAGIKLTLLARAKS